LGRKSKAQTKYADLPCHGGASADSRGQKNHLGAPHPSDFVKIKGRIKFGLSVIYKIYFFKSSQRIFEFSSNFVIPLLVHKKTPHN